MNFILAQVFGGIALILFIVSYFCNDKKLFFLIQIIGDIFYGLSFAVNLALVAGINTFISIIRGILFYIYERKKKEIPYTWVTIFSALYLLVGVLFFKNYLDIMVMITQILFTIAMWMKDMQKIRYFVLVPSVILVVYDILSQVYTTAILDCINVIVLIVALIKYRQKRV